MVAGAIASNGFRGVLLSDIVEGCSWFEKLL